MSVTIVGIGARRRVESIFEFIAGIPADTGMAYVFRTTPRSAIRWRFSENSSKRAALPVEEARDGLNISDRT
jgi:hypothetical protein